MSIFELLNTLTQRHKMDTELDNNLMPILSEIDSITHAVLDVVSDVSSCFAASDQIFIKVILGTINKNTSIGSLQNTKYSFRLLVSRMADISPTQIRKIFERLL